MNIPQIEKMAGTDEFSRHLRDVLVEMCAVDTSPRADVAAAGRAESQVFDILEREIKSFDLPAASLERKPINPAIADHPFFSQLYYTRSDARPEGLDVRDHHLDRRAR